MYIEGPEVTRDDGELDFFETARLRHKGKVKMVLLDGTHMEASIEIDRVRPSTLDKNLVQPHSVFEFIVDLHGSKPIDRACADIMVG